MGRLFNLGGGVPIPTSGLKVHLDFTDFSTITKTSNTITNVTDKSGNGNNFATGYASQGPDYDASLFRGKGGASFNGSTFLTSVQQLGFNKANYTAVVVLKKTDISGWFGLYDHTNGKALLGWGPSNRFGGGGASNYRSASGMPLNKTSVYAISSASGVPRYMLNGKFFPTFTDMGSSPSTGTFGLVNLGYGDTIDSFMGQVAMVLIYNRTLADSELQQLSRTLQVKFGCDGIPAQKANVVFDGNSIVNGTASTNPFPSIACLNAGLTEVDYKNFGIPGQFTVDMVNNAAARIDPNLVAGLRNILVVWEITNSLNAGISAATLQTNYTTYLTARRSAGWDKLIVVPCLPRQWDTTSREAARQTFNTWLKAASSLWDYCAWQTDASWALSGAENDGSLYPDGIHLSDALHAIVGNNTYLGGKIASALI